MDIPDGGECGCKVIAFAGSKFSGKDTVVNFVAESYKMRIMSFSDELKRIACDLYPWAKEDYLSSEKETLVIYKDPYTGREWTPRMLWAELDSLVRIDQNVLIYRLHDKIKHYACLRKGCVILIKDVRRPAELAYVRSFYNPTFIYIENPNNKVVLAENEVAESYQDILKGNADYTVVNDGYTGSYKVSIIDIMNAVYRFK